VVFQNNILSGVGGQGGEVLTVDDSVRFNDDDSAYLYRTPSAPGNRMTGSISLWYKRGNLGSIMQLFNAGAGDDITFNASDKLTFIDSSGVSYITTQVFRDPAAWGNLLFAWDTRLTTAGDRLRIYHNGVEITAFDTETDPSQYDQFEISNTVRQTIGANESDAEEFDGYFSQFYYVDGQQLTPTSFGEFDTNNVWRPIEFVTATVGTFGGDLTKPNSGVTVTAIESSTNAARAIDGDRATQWSEGTSATPAGAWWQIVFGSAIAIRQVSLYTAAGNNVVDDIDIESYNGSSWDVIQNITPVKNTTTQFFSVADSTARTTWRFITKSSPSAPYAWGINETTWMAAGTSVYGTNGFFLDFANSSLLGLDAAVAASTTTYRYLKLNVTEGGASTTYLSLGEMEYYVGATLYPTQTMTADDAPSPLVASASSALQDAYLAFNDDVNTHWLTQSGVLTGSLTIDLGSGNGIAPDSFRLCSPETPDRTPNNFTIQGSNNDSDYTVLATYAGFSTVTPPAKTFFGYAPMSNGNNFISSGLAAADQVVDTPTTNWGVMNVLQKSLSGPLLSNGNLTVSDTSGANHTTFGSMLMPTGKWYWEVTWVTGTGNEIHAGIIDSQILPGATGKSSTTSYRIYFGSGTLYNANVSGGAYGGATLAAGDIIQIAYDADGGKIWFGRDGTFQGDPAAGTGEAYASIPAGQKVVQIQTYGASPAQAVDCNFGQLGFAHTAPTDFNALNTANLATPTILDGTKNFQTTLYTGDGSTRNIDQTGNNTFQPDFVWIKNRSQADTHMLIDAARGVTEAVHSDSTGGQTTDADGLTSFDSDGFGLGTGAGGFNDNTENFVGWQWLAGGGAGSSNEEGSINTITTTVNTTAGISISTYTGTGANATIGHGLTNAPNAVWGKRSSGSESWMCWFEGMAGTAYFGLNSAVGSATSATVWNSTVPSSTLISLGSNASINGSLATNVIWCFESIEGFSKFSNYLGNGDADGPYVYTGFKPAWVMIKKTSDSGGWVMYDSQRSPYNEIDDQFFADTTAAETTGSEELDFLSNGFKIRTVDSAVNNPSGGTYVYAAFAEYPFGGTDVTPATTF
jgi:hypothetical protein